MFSVVKVIPHEYRRVLEEQAAEEAAKVEQNGPKVNGSLVNGEMVNDDDDEKEYDEDMMNEIEDDDEEEIQKVFVFMPLHNKSKIRCGIGQAVVNFHLSIMKFSC